jgi:hypothetical protein
MDCQLLRVVLDDVGDCEAYLYLAVVLSKQIWD